MNLKSNYTCSNGYYKHYVHSRSYEISKLSCNNLGYYILYTVKRRVILFQTFNAVNVLKLRMI